MSFGAWSSVLRRLIIPQDAGTNDPRTVIGGEVPDYLAGKYPGIIASKIDFFSSTIYYYYILVENPTGVTLSFVAEGLVRENVPEITEIKRSYLNSSGTTVEFGDNVGPLLSARDPDQADLSFEVRAGDGVQIQGGGSTSGTVGTRIHAVTHDLIMQAFGSGDNVQLRALNGGAVRLLGPVEWRNSVAGAPSRSQFSEQGSNFDNFSSLTFVATPGAPVIDFVVPPSGRGTIKMFVRQDADTTGERFQADVQIVQNPGPILIHSAQTNDAGIEWVDPGAGVHTYSHYGERPLETVSGLTPGETYEAELRINTQGTSTDITHQWIRFEPSL